MRHPACTPPTLEVHGRAIAAIHAERHGRVIANDSPSPAPSFEDTSSCETTRPTRAGESTPRRPARDLPLLRRRAILGHRGLHERLERAGIDPLPFVDVEGRQCRWSMRCPGSSSGRRPSSPDRTHRARPRPAREPNAHIEERENATTGPAGPAASSGNGGVVVSLPAAAPAGCSTARIGTYGGETAVGNDGATFQVREWTPRGPPSSSDGNCVHLHGPYDRRSPNSA
jgi:hypothetical protein